MKKWFSSKYSGFIIASAMTALVITLLFVLPGAVFSMTVTMTPTKGDGATFLLGETITFDGQASLAQGEIQDILSATLAITGVAGAPSLSATLPLTEGVHDISSQLPQVGGQPVGRLVATVVYQNVTYTGTGYGYGYVGGTGGGIIIFTVDYTPPIYRYPQPGSGEMTMAGSYTSKLTVVSTGGTEESTVSSYNISSDILVTPIYVPGQVSALDRDLVVYQVNVRDPMVSDVVIAGTSNSLLSTSTIHPVLVDKWLATGTWFYPYWIPEGTPAGNITADIDVYGAGTRPTVTGTGTATVVNSRSKFNIYLMPGANQVSFPMLPTTGTKFDLATLLNQPVQNASQAFVTGLGHSPTLADVVESIWYYTGGATPEWKSYTPGPSADDLTEAGLFQGLWIFTKSAAFKSFVSAPSPIKMTLTGRGIEAASGEVPPTFDVSSSWNLVGLVSERDSTRNHMLESLDGASTLKTWQNYTKLMPGIGGGSPYVDVKTGVYKGLYNSDPIYVGQGFWLYRTAAGVLVPVWE